MHTITSLDIDISHALCQCYPVIGLALNGVLHIAWSTLGTHARIVDYAQYALLLNTTNKIDVIIAFRTQRVNRFRTHVL